MDGQRECDRRCRKGAPAFTQSQGSSSLACIAQADALRVKVGYPLSPNTEDPRSLASWYSRVTIKNDTFFENILSAE